MAHTAHQPGPVCLEGGVSRWLVGVMVGLGGGAAPAPTRGAWGASSIRVPKKNARHPSATVTGAARSGPRFGPGFLALLAGYET